jgi:hypothetical protein
LLNNDDEKEKILEASKIPVSILEKSQPYIIGLLLLIGFSLDMLYCGLSAFPRSGALVVCVGIFTGLKLYSLIASSQEEVYQAITVGRDKLYRPYIDATGKISLPTTNIPNAEELYEASINALEASLLQLRTRIIKLEMVSLMVGTVVWGFGDTITLIRCGICNI